MSFRLICKKKKKKKNSMMDTMAMEGDDIILNQNNCVP